MKKSSFLNTLMLLVAIGASAQDSYREAVKEYCHLNGDASQITSALKLLNPSLFVADGSVDLDQLSERYFENVLVMKVADELKERGVAEGEIKKLNSLLSTPAGKDFVVHRLDWSEALRSELSTQLMQHLPQIMSGNISESIQPKAEIESEYVDKFKKFMGPSIIETYMKMFDESSGIKGLDLLPESTKRGLSSWIEANLMALALNSAHGIITDADLGFATKLYSEDVFKKVQNVSAINFDLTNGKIGDMISDYINWMKEQGVTTVNGISNLFKLLGN